MNFGANDCIIGVICGQNGVMSRRMLPHLRGFCPIFEAEALFREAGQLKIRGQQAAIFFDFFFHAFSRPQRNKTVPAPNRGLPFVPAPNRGFPPVPAPNCGLPAVPAPGPCFPVSLPLIQLPLLFLPQKPPLF